MNTSTETTESDSDDFTTEQYPRHLSDISHLLAFINKPTDNYIRQN
jgi:hypothetical protein